MLIKNMKFSVSDTVSNVFFGLCEVNTVKKTLINSFDTVHFVCSVIF